MQKKIRGSWSLPRGIIHKYCGQHSSKEDRIGSFGKSSRWRIEIYKSQTPLPPDNGGKDKIKCFPPSTKFCNHFWLPKNMSDNRFPGDSHGFRGHLLCVPGVTKANFQWRNHNGFPRMPHKLFPAYMQPFCGGHPKQIKKGCTQKISGDTCRNLRV